MKVLKLYSMYYDNKDLGNSGLGDRELPHRSNCNKGVYNHDAGLYCPFCGALMKNPMRI